MRLPFFIRFKKTVILNGTLLVACNGIYYPCESEGETHRKADGEQFLEEDGRAVDLAQRGEEREPPCQLSVDDVIDYEHDGTSPEHLLESREIAQKRRRFRTVNLF